MTIIIGFNLGSCILLAADTRTTCYGKNGTETYYDESEKIQKTKFGIITGAGAITLLDPVKKRMAEDPITNTDDMLKIIREERKIIMKTYSNHQKPSKQILSGTGWLFSYPTIIEETPCLRLCVYHPSLGDDLGIYEEGRVAVIAPAEATVNEAEGISDILQETIKMDFNNGNIENIFLYYHPIISTAIKTLNPKYKSISEHVQYGIHTIDNRYGITRIIKEIDKSFSLTLNTF